MIGTRKNTGKGSIVARKFSGRNDYYGKKRGRCLMRKVKKMREKLIYFRE